MGRRRGEGAVSGAPPASPWVWGGLGRAVLILGPCPSPDKLMARGAQRGAPLCWPQPAARPSPAPRGCAFWGAKQQLFGGLARTQICALPSRFWGATPSRDGCVTDGVVEVMGAPKKQEELPEEPPGAARGLQPGLPTPPRVPVLWGFGRGSQAERQPGGKGQAADPAPAPAPRAWGQDPANKPRGTWGHPVPAESGRGQHGDSAWGGRSWGGSGARAEGGRPAVSPQLGRVTGESLVMGTKGWRGLGSAGEETPTGRHRARAPRCVPCAAGTPRTLQKHQAPPQYGQERGDEHPGAKKNHGTTCPPLAPQPLPRCGPAGRAKPPPPVSPCPSSDLLSPAPPLSPVPSFRWLSVAHGASPGHGHARLHVVGLFFLLFCYFFFFSPRAAAGCRVRILRCSGGELPALPACLSAGPSALPAAPRTPGRRTALGPRPGMPSWGQRPCEAGGPAL